MTQRPLSVQPAVSVVISTCANAFALERAITSVIATRYEPLEIVVVENRPPAPSTRRVAEELFEQERVRYLEESRRGASWARNTGLAHATGDIVAFTDDDVVVHPAWIESAVTTFETHEQAACVTGRILPMSLSTPELLLFEQFAAFDKGEERRVFRLPESRVSNPLFPYVTGQVGSGANVFIRRDVALAMGGFDPLLGAGTRSLGGEDLDLFIRLMHGGRTIVYDPAVVLRHEHPGCPQVLRQHAYHYGVGLTAMLGKQLLRGPARRTLLKAIPAGVRYGLNPESRKNATKSGDFPRTLELLERLGMLFGPFAYLLSLAESTVRRRRRHTVDMPGGGAGLGRRSRA